MNDTNTAKAVSYTGAAKNLILSVFGKKSDLKASTPFWVLVNKEIADHIQSWRFMILIAIVALTCLGSMYTSLTSISEAIKPAKGDTDYLFLKLFTVTDGSLPSFYIFVGFLGPLLGISLGFDVINSEQSRGTMSRVLAQPIPRDHFINAKFVSALLVVSVMLFALSFLVMGIGIIAIGIPPTPEEFIRVIVFTLFSIVYVAFWLNLSIFFSMKFQQPATSALSSISVWLFFTVFHSMIVNVIFKALVPSGNLSIAGQKWKLGFLRIAPNQLFDDASTSILIPIVRSLGPLTTKQLSGAIPSPIPIGQSILLVWPQLTILIALTVLCFVSTYYMFMRREIRS